MGKISTFIGVAILALVAFSCSNRNEIITNEDSSLNREELVIKELKFLPLEKQIGLRSFNNIPPNNKPDLDIVIVRVEFGRKSKNCRGFGVCDVEWFPGFDMVANPEDNIQPSLLTYMRENPETGEHYIELPLAESPNPKFTNEDLTLKIDAPLEFISNGEDSLGESYIAPAKELKLDPKVGEHGGYKIELIPNP